MVDPQLLGQRTNYPAGVRRLANAVPGSTLHRSLDHPIRQGVVVEGGGIER